MTTGAGIGAVADIAAGGPLLRYTYTFASLPSCATYCSAKLSPPVIEHTGSMLMSIFTGAGALPERWIVPLTVPRIAGSRGALVAGAACPSAVVCLPASLGLHPTNPPNTLPASAAVINQPQIRLMQFLSNILVENHSQSHALKAPLSLGHRRFHGLKHGIRKRLRSACTANIPGQGLALTVHLLDSRLYPFCRRALVDVMQHQHRALQQGSRVGHILTSYIGRRSMHGLKDRALGPQVRARNQTKSAYKRA